MSERKHQSDWAETLSTAAAVIVIVWAVLEYARAHPPQSEQIERVEMTSPETGELPEPSE